MDILKKGIEAQAQSLREFGYPDVTAEMVKDAHTKWMAGEAATGVIAMFSESAFNEHPEIFGTPTQ